MSELNRNKRMDNGSIYRIICNTTGLVYFGSTNQKLSKRLGDHVCTYKNYLKGGYHYVSSFAIIENNNYDIILVENYPCGSKEELHKRERFYIENNDCVNQCIPTQTKKEWTEKNYD